MTSQLDIKAHYERMKVGLQVLEDDTRFRIYGYLMIYSRLGLSDLATCLNLTKSAVSRQIRKLEAINLVLTEEENVRGPIAKKWYFLNHDFLDIPAEYSTKKLQIPQSEIKLIEVYQYELYGLICKFYIKFLQFSMTQFEKHSNQIKTEPLNSPFPPIPFGFRMRCLSKQNWKTFLERYVQFIQNNKDLFDSENENNAPQYFGFFTGFFPLDFALNPN